MPAASTTRYQCTTVWRWYPGSCTREAARHSQSWQRTCTEHSCKQLHNCKQLQECAVHILFFNRGFLNLIHIVVLTKHRWENTQPHIQREGNVTTASECVMTKYYLGDNIWWSQHLMSSVVSLSLVTKWMNSSFFAVL